MRLGKLIDMSVVLWIFTLIIFSLIVYFYSKVETYPDFIILILLVDILVGIASFCCIFIFYFIKIFKSKTDKETFSSSTRLDIHKKIATIIMKHRIVIIITTIFLFVFMWFQIRPAIIKNACQKESDEYIGRGFNLEDKDNDGLIPQKSIDWLNNHAKIKYERCLHRNGL